MVLLFSLSSKPLSSPQQDMSQGSIVDTKTTREPSPARIPPEEGFEDWSSVAKLEEESLPWYNAEYFYPVRLGQVFQSRYQVLAKLGYGSCSTIWLCRDLQVHTYVALKVCISNYPSVQRELAAYAHLLEVKSDQIGRCLIRRVLDDFKLPGPKGEHQCFVHEPLGATLQELKYAMPGYVVVEPLMKGMISYMFLALDFLHNDAKMVHTDLQTDNFLLQISRETLDSCFDALVSEEMNKPCPRKVLPDRVIYVSRIPNDPAQFGYPILCDFGEARFGKDSYLGLIQPEPFRAPEVLLEMPWNHKVDIWNFALMIWHWFESKLLITSIDDKGDRSTEYQLAVMVGLLGPPPLYFLRRSEASWTYFDSESGAWKGLVPIPDLSLEAAEVRLEGKEKTLFLAFIRKMLQWDPEKRTEVRELRETDEWLTSQGGII